MEEKRKRYSEEFRRKTIEQLEQEDWVYWASLMDLYSLKRELVYQIKLRTRKQA